MEVADNNSVVDEEVDTGGPQWEIDPGSLTMGKRIGGGVFGDVFRAKLWGTAVAVKALKPIAEGKSEGSEGEDEMVVELKKEASILSGLRHPNVVLYIGLSLSLSLSLSNPVSLSHTHTHIQKYMCYMYISGACTLDPRNLCIVTEWCAKGSLFDVIHAGSTPISCALIIDLAMGVAQVE